MDDGRVLDRVEDLLHRVADWQHVARRVLEAIVLAGVHERRRVRKEVAVNHHLVKGGGDLQRRGRAPAVPGLARRDGPGDAPAHFLWRLEDVLAVAREISLTEHAPRRFGPPPGLRRTSLRQHTAPPYDGYERTEKPRPLWSSSCLVLWPRSVLLPLY